MSSDSKVVNLRDYVRNKSIKAELRSRINREYAASMAHLARFKSEHPNWFGDPSVTAALWQATVDEQRRDLEYDAPRFRELVGRDPTDNETVQRHQFARAHGYPNARPVDQLIKDAVSTIEVELGIRTT
jgi:hypothetical protein